MRKYLLDINIISYLADAESPFHENVRKRFRALGKEDVVALSVLGLYEFYYSFSRADDDLDPQILRTKEKVCTTLPVILLSDEGAKVFGELKAVYQNRYRLPRTALAHDTVDLMIVASALETGSVLVSHEQVFRTIQAIHPALQLEDWAQ